MRRLINISVLSLGLLFSSISNAGVYFAGGDDVMWRNSLLSSTKNGVTVHVVVTPEDVDYTTGTWGQIIVGNGSGGLFTLGFNESGYPYWCWYRSGGVWERTTGSTLLTDGQTIALTGMWSQNSPSPVYLNGVQDGVTTSSNYLLLAQEYNFTIGSGSLQSDDIGFSWAAFKGTVHDVCIWQGTLSVSDLQTLGKSRVKGICRTIQPSSLIAYFDLDSWGDGTQVDDYEYPSRIVATEAYTLNVNGGASVLSKAESFLTYK